MSKMSSILAVGSVALDSVKTPFGKVVDALGGSATFFSASARFFSNVSIVAVVGEDFPKKHLLLFKRLSVDTNGIQIEKGKTFRWSGYYDFDLNVAKTLKTELNVFQNFKPILTQTHRDSSNVFLANIDPVIQKDVLSQVYAPKLVACDTMNYWIENKKADLLKLIPKVDIFLCNDSEARELSGEYNLLKACRWIKSKGPKIVVIKKGEHGVICFYRGAPFLAPAFLLEKVFDPTGAGDTFAGGFVGYLSSQNGRVTDVCIRRAIVYGSVLASYNVESFSLDRLSGLTFSGVLKRFEQFKRLTRID